MINDTKKLENLFLSLGYTKEDYQKIITTYPINNLKEETLIKKVNEVYNYLSEMYTKEEVIKMTKSMPAIYGYSIENIKQKIEDMINLGYTKEEVIKMTKSMPTIYNLSIENVKQKIEDIVSLGYSKEEIIKMTKRLPQIYSYSIENMKQKIEDIISLGYSKEEVIKMTKSMPQIYSLSIENMKQKIDFYDSIYMHQLAIIDSKQLMQSVALTFSRYMFYLSKGITIDMSNYKKLYMNNKQFEKQYNITKKELLEKYNYEEYLKQKENGRTI